MSKGYWWFKFVVCSLLISIYSLAQASPIKIGCVDMQRVIKESMAGKESSEAGSHMVQEKRNAVSRLENEIGTMFNEFKKKEMLLSPEAKLEFKGNIEKKMIEKERVEKDSYRELRRFEKEAISKIVNEANKVVQQIAKQGAFTLILDSTELERGGRDIPLSNILYAVPELDITDRVIESYDKQHKAGKDKE